MPKRRPSKQDPFITLLLVTLVAIVVPVFSKVSDSADNTKLLWFVITLGVLVCVLVTGIIIFVEQRKIQALRALKIASVDNMSGVEFERYVGSLLKSKGYRIRYTKASGDYGVDIVAKKDGVTTAVQVKRYKNTIGQDAIRQAFTGMSVYNCTRSMVITNSSFTSFAKTLAATNKCELIDRIKLGEWISEFQLR